MFGKTFPFRLGIFRSLSRTALLATSDNCLWAAGKNVVSLQHVKPKKFCALRDAAFGDDIEFVRQRIRSVLLVNNRPLLPNQVQ